MGTINTCISDMKKPRRKDIKYFAYGRHIATKWQSWDLNLGSQFQSWHA